MCWDRRLPSSGKLGSTSRSDLDHILRGRPGALRGLLPEGLSSQARNTLLNLIKILDLTISKKPTSQITSL